jgi:signal transduction histidine kinase
VSDPTATPRSSLRQERRNDFLSGSVVLALIALLLSPLVVQRRVHGMRDEIEHAADPARTLVTEVQYLLARQTSVLRGYFIARDTASLRQFRDLQEEELRVYEELSPLVARLGDRVLAHYVELRTLSRQWHERLDSDEIAASLRDGDRGVDELPFEQTLYLEALTSAASLDDAIAQETSARRVEIQRAEGWGLMVGAVLAVLALAAALAVAYLSYRVRLLAREAEARRLLAEQALEAKDQAILARTRLLRGVTHDVMNPLGAADAYADLLEQGLKGPLPPPQLEFIGKIRQCLRGSLNIVADLLDLATAESGELHVAPAPTSLTKVVREVVEEYRAIALRAGQTLDYHVPSGAPEISTDENRIRQVLGNLLSNAVKYTPPPGRIEVRLDWDLDRRTGGNQRWFALRVSDSGPGIPETHREAIFEEFSRLRVGGAEGYGLGLAISRRIARLLGGEVTVSHASLGGAEFTLWLPPDGAAAGEEEGGMLRERASERPVPIERDELSDPASPGTACRPRRTGS